MNLLELYKTLQKENLVSIFIEYIKNKGGVIWKKHGKIYKDMKDFTKLVI